MLKLIPIYLVRFSNNNHGYEEQSGTIESQEKSGIDSTREIAKDQSKVKLNKRLKKLSNQLNKHFNVNKKMQNQLSKLNKMVNSGSRQQLVIRDMQAQIKVIETQLTEINSGIARFKTSSKQDGKTGNKKAKTKVLVR